MKKLLMPILMYLGSFAAINTGMYFFLDATQPKTTTQMLLANQTDSTQTDQGMDGDLHKTDEMKSFNSEEIPKTESHGDVKGKADQTSKDDADVDDAKAAIPEDIAEHQNNDGKQKTDDKVNQIEPKAAETNDKKQEDQVTPAVLAGNSKEMIKLSRMLESMKPAEAAAVLTNLKDDAVVSLVMKMKERNAAKILAAMPIDQAARVAEKMAEMADIADRK